MAFQRAMVCADIVGDGRRQLEVVAKGGRGHTSCGQVLLLCPVTCDSNMLKRNAPIIVL